MKTLEWKEKIDSIHKMYLEKIETCSPEEVLYHYTSPGGLLGILNTSSLWLTDSDYLNDASESYYFAEICEHASRLEGTPQSPYHNSFPFRASMIPIYHTEFHRARETIRGEREVRYILSLSNDADNISLWNYYTKTAESIGYCLGFMSDLLIASIRADGEIVHGKVIYDRDVQMELLNRLLIDYWNAYKGLRHTYQRNYLFEKLEHNLVVFSIFMKDACFSCENEYRIAVIKVGTSTLSDRKFRVVNGAFVPYINGDIDTRCISKVGISPTHKIDIAKKSINDLMLSLNLDVCVYSSTIPLRY